MAAVDQLSRVVALIDMDCFYCACERALQPELNGKPVVVVQYNPTQGDGSASESGVRTVPPEPATARVVARAGELCIPSSCNGSIIAVSYEARERGVTRFMRGREAREQCPDVTIIQVPTAHGKSDMGLYRTYGAKVRSIIAEVCGPSAAIEKASVDEIYIDLTSPARSLLDSHGLESTVAEAGEVDTHVAGAAEGASEAAMGQQTPGPLGRSAFRAGHSGQVKRAMNAASCAWWSREVSDWPRDEALLGAAATIVARARAAVTEQLGFTCSAGVAANKMLAKLCGGLHKPNQQTLLPPAGVQDLLDPLPVDRLRGFGGKLGDLLKRGKPDLGIAGFDSAGALRQAGAATVASVLRGEWPHPEEKAQVACQMAAGRDDAAVDQRPCSKQIGGGKNFSGSRGLSRGPLDTYAELEGWVREFAEDVWGRMEEEEEMYGRIATQLVVNLSLEGDKAGHSKRCKLRPGVPHMVSDAMVMFRHLTSDRPHQRLGIVGVGLSGDSFVSSSGKAERGALQRMFQKSAASSTEASDIKISNVADHGACKRPLEESTKATIDNSFQDAQPLSLSLAANSPAATNHLVFGQIGGSSSGSREVLGFENQSKRLRSVVIDVSEDILDRKSQTPTGTEIAVQWSCPACTFLNHPSVRSCEMCSTPRDVTPELCATPRDVTPAARSDMQACSADNTQRVAGSSETSLKRGKARKSIQKTPGIAQFFLKSGQ